jgi:hypothetical protein
MIYGWQLCFLYVSSSTIPQEDLYPVDAYPQKWIYCRDAMSCIRETIRLWRDDPEILHILHQLRDGVIVIKKKQGKLCCFMKE